MSESSPCSHWLPDDHRSKPYDTYLLKLISLPLKLSRHSIWLLNADLKASFDKLIMSY